MDLTTHKLSARIALFVAVVFMAVASPSMAKGNGGGVPKALNVQVGGVNVASVTYGTTFQMVGSGIVLGANDQLTLLSFQNGNYQQPTYTALTRNQASCAL